ncbi:MAG: exodeoxyribonuclease VII large subunit, partial [Rubrivivax sp.]
MIEPSSPVPQRQVWDVGALLLATGDLLQARFGAVTVKGELSGLARAASGHRYFALKDLAGASALLRCAMFRRAVTLLDFDVQDGQQVEVRGRVVVYEPRGELQLVVESMRRLGAGALYEQFLRSKARLEAEGLFERERKRPIPA